MNVHEITKTENLDKDYKVYLGGKYLGIWTLIKDYMINKFMICNDDDEYLTEKYSLFEIERMEFKEEI